MLEVQPAARELGQGLLDEVPERRIVRNILENFPEVLFHARAQPFEVWVVARGLAKGRRLHVHHKQSRTTTKHVSFYAVVFRVNCELAQLAVEVRIFEYAVVAVLFGQHLTLNFLDGDVGIPDFRRIVHFAAHVVAFLNNRVEFLDEEILAVDFGHASCKTEVGDDEFALAVNEQIFGFNIAVYDAVAVQVLNALHQLR